MEGMKEGFAVAFIGTRDLLEFSGLSTRIEEVVEDLILRHGFVTFYIGRNGGFDILAASCIKRVQGRLGRETCSLVLVQPYPFRDAERYQDYYDDRLFPVPPNTHFRAAVTKRNDWMLEHCQHLIAFVQQKSGGEYTMLRKALQKGMPVQNLAEEFMG